MITKKSGKIWTEAASAKKKSGPLRVKSASSDQNLQSITFWHRFGIGSLQIKFFVKRDICLTETARNEHFSNMKFKWKK